MKPSEPPDKAPHHPGHHWGSFADDPWSDDLDPVTGEAWERAVRASRSSAMRRSPLDTDPRRADHWGSFASDPWCADLDPVTGEAWDQAMRASRSRAGTPGALLNPEKLEAARTGDGAGEGGV